jgi:HEAT repeat protein
MLKHGAMAAAALVLLAGTGAAAPAAERQPVQHWINQLKNGDAVGREEAVRRIAALGPQGRAAAPALVALLKERSNWFVVEVAKALLAIGAPEAEAATRELLFRRAKCTANFVEGPYLDQSPGVVVGHLTAILRKDRDPHAREKAASVLGRLRYPSKGSGAPPFLLAGRSADQVVPALTATLKDASPRVRLVAARSLVNLDARQSRTVAPTVVALIADGTADPFAYHQLLRHAEAEAVPALVRLLESENEQVRARGGSALAYLAPGSVPALAKALREGPARARLPAARALGGVYSGLSAAVPALTAALADEEKAVRYEAALTLARADRKKAPLALPLLVTALRGRDGYGPRAGYALVTLGADARPAVPGLLRALKDEHPEARARAAYALAAIDPVSAGPAVPTLVEALRSENYSDQLSAAVAAGQIGPPARATLPGLRAALSARHKQSRQHRLVAAEALMKIDRAEAKVVVPALVELLDSRKFGDGGARSRALDALQRMGPDAAPAVPALMAELHREEEGPFRLELAGAAVRIAPDRAGPAMKVLRAALRGPKSDWEHEALGVLERLGPLGREALPELTPLLRSDSPHTVAHAARVLGGIGPAARPAVPQLRGLLKHTEPQVRRAADEALRKIGAPE